MPQLTIVQAVADDVEALTPLFDAYRTYFAGHGDREESRRFLQLRFALHDSVIFIARFDSDSAGFIQLYPLWSSWYCRRIWFLSDLYVEQRRRKCGAGRGLVERAIAYARESDAASIIVELPRREPHLREFYARLGFVGDEVFDLARLRFDPIRSEERLVR